MKRIVLCLDGTWNTNEPGSILTNVAKLHGVIPPMDAQGVRQVPLYVEGIASTQGEFAQFAKGAAGWGVSDRIGKAYDLLVRWYKPGDEIYIFGFSRGAFQARRLAGFIALFGVAKWNGAFSFDKAWALHCRREAKRDQASVAELRALSDYPARIKCVGVWDTVGNLGNPFITGLFSRRYAFHDSTPLAAMDVGLHALCIDETRGPFRPTLWTLPEGRTLPPGQRVEQVWFAGSHADVGGGYKETKLSDVSLLWMAERAAATTGLAFDTEKLARATRPDPLGPQHSGATGAIFGWSALFPFIRILNQAELGIPAWRAMLIGAWRTGKLPPGQTTVNESIHESVVDRFGQKVIELKGGRARVMTYGPQNLAAVLPEPLPAKPAPATDKPRRVKLFTVHGTFDHAANWDDWDKNDDPKTPPEKRAFVNRLRERLGAKNVILDEDDHTQYDWSGGNSHDERRTAAIGLKKAIEDDLCKTYEKHGKDYYDGGVYVIGHSHGGTISRLAMNLWDKGHDYYDPADEKEFKHDDTCQTCMRSRNGAVGPNTALRPDGVVTFGSPFVNFEPRPGGLLTAKIGAWVYRALLIVPAALFFGIFIYSWLQQYGAVEVAEGMKLDPAKMALKPEQISVISAIFAIAWPLALYWLIAAYLPRATLPRIESWFGKGGFLFAMGAVLQILTYVVIATLALYYAAYFSGGTARVGEWFPFLRDGDFRFWALVVGTILGVWVTIVTLPSWFLSWLERKVSGLRERLPKKYDPREDRPVSYVSYHTPGDEAGLHLRIFGGFTWLVQTLALSMAFMLALGIALLPLIGIEALGALLFGGGPLSLFGVSAFGENMAYRDNFIAVMDWLTWLPKTIWTDLLGYSGYETLGALPNARDVAWYVPAALAINLLILFVLLMPLMLVAFGLVYLVSMLLRGSGYVFGGETMAWTLANRIAVTRRPNETAALRVFFITPEAWWRKEIAHCYYYKSARVIDDVASHIANWAGRAPTPAWPVERWFASGARWAVVALLALGVIAGAVPMAKTMAVGPQGLMSGSSSSPSKPMACEFTRSDVVVRVAEKYFDQREAILANQWEREMSFMNGGVPFDFANAEDKDGPVCSQVGGEPFYECTLKAKPCVPLECKAEPHVASTAIAGSSEATEADYNKIIGENFSKFTAQWETEASEKFGAEWGKMSRAQGWMMRRIPCEKGADGLVACKLTATPCRVPDQGAAAPVEKAQAGAPAADAAPPAAKPEFIEDEAQICRAEPHWIKFENTPGTSHEANYEGVRPQWEAEVRSQYGTEWADWKAATPTLTCEMDRPHICAVGARPCKWRPQECKDSPHVAETTFETSNLDAEMKPHVNFIVGHNIYERWKSEVAARYGEEWSDHSFNFRTLDKYRAAHGLKPSSEGCKEEELSGGRTRFQCTFAAAPCKKPPPKPDEGESGGRRGRSP